MNERVNECCPGRTRDAQEQNYRSEPGYRSSKANISHLSLPAPFLWKLSPSSTGRGCMGLDKGSAAFGHKPLTPFPASTVVWNSPPHPFVPTQSGAVWGHMQG